MPTYDYECPKCAHRLERFHGINERIEIACPLCGEETRRCITSTHGFILRGSGFYATDYKQKEKKEKKG